MSSSLKIEYLNDQGRILFKKLPKWNRKSTEFAISESHNITNSQLEPANNIQYHF